MKIEIPYQTYSRLKELLEILDTARQAHEPTNIPSNYQMDGNTELIEPWSPSDWKDEEGTPVTISCPKFTVGTLRMASKLKEDLKL